MKNKRFKKLVRWMCFLALVAFITYGALGAIKENKARAARSLDGEEVQAVTESASDQSLKAIMNDPQFQVEMQLKAKKILTTRELADENARHAQEVKDLEAKLEAIRAEELKAGEQSFQ